uniref:Uncharacterized protein n=1 Tax=Rhizophora mucronata TaxID=61149 RepID=A0A2P2KAS4_RHIMU
MLFASGVMPFFPAGCNKPVVPFTTISKVPPAAVPWTTSMQRCKQKLFGKRKGCGRLRLPNTPSLIYSSQGQATAETNKHKDQCAHRSSINRSETNSVCIKSFLELNDLPTQAAEKPLLRWLFFQSTLHGPTRVTTYFLKE